MSFRRKFFDFGFKLTGGASALILVGALLLIVEVIVSKGIGSISWEMITRAPKEGMFEEGSGGGVANAIMGSLYLGVGATVIALILSVPTALYLRVYAGGFFAGLIRWLLDILWGVPSIVFGAFGFTIMLAMGMRASLLAGMITVAMFELPVLIRAIDEVVKMVPAELEESSYVLGATRSETAFRVVARQALSGVVTGTLLAFCRGIGDAASVLFTAGYTDRIPGKLTDPVATLPLSIFYQLGTPFEEAHKKAYGAALLLVIIVLVTSIVARLVGARLGKNAIK